jgi:uncharacterized protein YqfA (UPF0365 family)
MSWQSLAVVIVVAAAVFFLIARVVGVRLRRNRPAQTFVPLSSLKKGTPRK